MRSIQLAAPRTLEERKVSQPPDPGPGEVLVRLRAVGICGSDMHWYLEGGVGWNNAIYPMVLGHEPVGEIVSVGPGVTGRQTGQRVSIEPTVSCGHCDYCLRGCHNNCVHGVFMGGPHAEGFFREFAVVPVRNTDIVPQEIDFTKASLIEPLAVIVHVLQLVEMRVGDTVVVLGAGSIGMLCGAVARAAGAARVFAADKVPHRLELAKKMGADVTIHTPSEKIVDAVMDYTHGLGADLVLDAAGAVETINAGIKLCRPGGNVVLIGIPSEKNLNIDLHTAMAKELRIQTIKRSNHQGHGAAELLRSGRIPTSLITHLLPLEKTPAAFEMLAAYADGVGKIVIEMP